jgi:DNA-binding winged helix-turn-helix (wHTH) protein
MRQLEHRFDQWTFQPGSRRLQKGKRIYRLPPQHTLVLSELVTHAGRVVTRDRLINLLWPTRVVNFHPSLNAIIKATRKLLSDNSRRPRYIETVHREGYRFVAAPPSPTPAAAAVMDIVPHLADQSLVAAAAAKSRSLQRIIDAGVELVGAEFGSIFLLVANAQGVYQPRFEVGGLPRSRFEGFAAPRNTDLFNRSFRGEFVVSADISKDPRFGRNPPHNGVPKGHPAVVSYMGVPATTHDGQVIAGLFFGHSKPARFGVVEQRHVMLFAGVAAEALAAQGEHHVRVSSMIQFVSHTPPS